MDFKTYKEKYFTEPAPLPRFEFKGILGVSLFFQPYEEAVKYYEQVLGPPAYSEGESTRGWRLGNTWLTLMRAEKGTPKNFDINLVMESPQEAGRLQQAFIDAGGSGQTPREDLMYEPVHICPVTDPFGTEILITSPVRQM